jgi:ATP-dependent Lhr-like helicase
LGNTSYRILRVERGVVRVEDAQGATPSIPFWLGEAPGRSDELSAAVSRLRATAALQLQAAPDGESMLRWLTDAVGIGQPAALQIVEYLLSGRAALGCLPTQETIVLERFFDEAGGMQLVVHSPYGSRLNRAWGLALRKRFCRKFNFELQAAATEDNIVLSLTTAHSFELGEVARYLNSTSVREVLIQALLDAPMFITRWRWVAAVSLALPRFWGGRKVPPQLARMQAEDLIAQVFPDQIACAENLAGEREVPDHPLVKQTIADCLGEAMDLAGLQRLLRGIESGTHRVVACDLTEPSPLALEVLSARPYAYLDDAPLEERRTQAVMARRWLDAETAGDLGRLDPEAIARVRAEAWPEAVNRDELHDALVWFGFLSESEVAAASGWSDWLAELAHEKRAARLRLTAGAVWIAAERIAQFRTLWPAAHLDPPIAASEGLTGRGGSAEEALREIVRGRLEGQGPIMPEVLSQPLGLQPPQMAAALAALETEGFVMRGRFTPGLAQEEWCERRLLARIHSYTIKRLRAEIEPVAARDFLRFLLSWQHVAEEARMEGPNALDEVVGQLEGYGAPAVAWETEILPARLTGYEPAWLDDRCLSGHLTWTRLLSRNGRTGGERRAAPVRTTPIALLTRPHGPFWVELAQRVDPAEPSPRAQHVVEFLNRHGASFFDEMTAGSGLLRSELESALAELVALGLVTCDSFAGLRALLVPSDRRQPFAGARRRRRTVTFGMESAGRWSLVRRVPSSQPSSGLDPQAVEHLARTLLRRYGVVFWRLLEREAGWLPPWRDLLRIYRKLERRGEIRGGRFVAGFSGEQFALPDAIGALRQARRKPAGNVLVSVSGADPLNLAGILTPGPRLPALTGNRVLYRDGLPVALLVGGEATFLEALEPAMEWQARTALLRSAMPIELAHQVA